MATNSLNPSPSPSLAGHPSERGRAEHPGFPMSVEDMNIEEVVPINPVNSGPAIGTIDIAGVSGMSDLNSLSEQITHVLHSGAVFSDIFIHEGSPLMLKQPNRVVAVADTYVERRALEDFFQILDPQWRDKIKVRAIDKAIDLTDFRIRANFFSFQGRKGLGAVVRRFPKEPVPLAELGLHQDAQKFAQLRHGLVLIIGDTSQGKSTTLASILDEINRTRSGHIVTVEDPVELLIPSRKCMITQREVGPDADVESFYHGTRDSLRQRPEVVMIGEIRDMETALEAVALAESGPLVFATLHAKSTEFGLMKMLRLLGDTENQAQALAQTLRGTICQALIPSLNGEAWHLASEVMTVNHDLARMIEQRNLSRIRPMMDSMAHQGCHLMNTDLLELYDNGQIRFEDACRATTDLPKFSAQFKPRN